MTLKLKQKIHAVAALVLFFGIVQGCKKVPIVYSTTDAVNIVGYLDEHPDSFSLFREMLAVTGYDGFLSAYGHYTLFLPTNTAVQTYLKQNGKDSVSQLNVDSLKSLLKFHLLTDTVYTISFTDGKLPYLTMYGQYLVTGAANINGVSYLTVNRTANVLEGNLREGNGVIHVIDHVLQPAVQTVAQMINSNTRYSIFTQALQATGLYDSLNVLPAANKDSTRAWVTLLAQSDSLFNANGINSFADLKAKYCNTGNPLNPADSLHLFVDYHILYGANYLADIVSASSFTTWAPLQAVTVKFSHDSVLINDDVFNGVHEPGILLNRAESDLSATNGVVHDAAGLLYLKIRSPFPVYWDVCQYPEIMNLPAYYQKQNYSYPWTALPSFITVPSTVKSQPQITYKAPTTSSSTSPTVNHDYLDIQMGNNRIPWVTLKTPLLVAGQYKVWICWRTAGKAQIIQVSVDSTIMQRTMDKSIYLPSGTDAVLEAQGWKHYTIYTNNTVPGYLVGTVNIPVTGQHDITFTALSGGDDGFWLDMIEFIPADMDQQWPRFDADGVAHYTAD